MMRVIPHEEVELRTDIQTYIDSIWNLAPEVLCGSECFIRIQTILNNNIDTDNYDADWVHTIAEIFNNNTLPRD